MENFKILFFNLSALVSGVFSLEVIDLYLKMILSLMGIISFAVAIYFKFEKRSKNKKNNNFYE